MRVAEIFAACQELLGAEISYDSLRTCLSHGARPDGPIVRLGYGRYALREQRWHDAIVRPGRFLGVRLRDQTDEES